jgi:hypothetical protein
VRENRDFSLSQLLFAQPARRFNDDRKTVLKTEAARQKMTSSTVCVLLVSFSFSRVFINENREVNNSTTKKVIESKFASEQRADAMRRSRGELSIRKHRDCVSKRLKKKSPMPLTTSLMTLCAAFFVAFRMEKGKEKMFHRGKNA